MSKNQNNGEALPADGLYPIRTVAAATGVNPVTLRAWERRYGLLHPRRTPKGHRLYTREQIDTIDRVTRLLSQGIAISQVRPLLAMDTSTSRDEAPTPTPPKDTWGLFAERMTDAVARFDTPALEAIYNEALSLYPLNSLNRRLIVPVLERLGACWKQSPSGIAQEHFLVGFLRNKIGARFHQQGAAGTGSRLVAACLPGELHETGLLLFCLDAMTRGYRIVYLGANTPLEQLPAVVESSGAEAVVLSTHMRPRNGLLGEALPALTARLGVPVFMGGPGSTASEGQLRAAGLIALGTNSEEALATIAAALASEH